MEDIVDFTKKILDVARQLGPGAKELIRLMRQMQVEGQPDPAIARLAEAARPSNTGDLKVAVILSRAGRYSYRTATVCADHYDRASDPWLIEEAQRIGEEAVLAWKRTGN